MERRFFQETFPQIDSQFSIIRLNTDGAFASLIFSCQTNILSVAALEEIIRIDGEVRGITAACDAQQFVFSDICASVNGTCNSNVMLDVLDYNASNTDFVNITFPEYCLSQFNCIHMGNIISKVEVDHNGVLRSAKAIRLLYYLQESNNTLEDAWLREFVDLLSNVTTSETEVSRPIFVVTTECV